MRLKKLKVAGFKSFVDPTTIPLPSNLVAVVGPNGCGKSNIIDAVRWVMGESSAKHLRGESMADVIFNGSDQRKPVGQASVELVFDNDDKRLAGTLGQYANFPEISIKRVVTRDGQSSYFINGKRCRRKDVTLIFSGTGLGPRSYAIIEQGMIARLIEAKPEEMRVHLEEVAGIAKYKERRRETEQRMNHTRDNLDRLNDIRDELEKTLQRLERQAKAAERFKELKTEQQLVEAQLYALRWQAIDKKLSQLLERMQQQRISVEQSSAQLTHLDTTIEQKRQLQHDANQQLEQQQETYYTLGSAIARLEEAISHQKQRRQQLTTDHQQASEELSRLQQEQTSDESELTKLTSQREQLLPKMADFKQQLEQCQKKRHQVHQELEQWQKSWEQFNQQAAESAKQAHTEQARIQQLEARLETNQSTRERLSNELSQFNLPALNAELSQAKTEHQEAEAALSALTESKQHSQQQVQQQQQTLTQQHSQLDTLKAEREKLNSEKTSLEALQAVALGKKQQDVVNWLRAHQLDTSPRLAEKIEVEAGWELAVERVLAEKLQGIVTDKHIDDSALLNELKNGTITLLADKNGRIDASESLPLNSLASKVSTDLSVINELLSGVLISEDLSQALTLRSKLNHHQSIITKDAIWLGANWMHYSKSRDEQSGTLARAQTLKATQQQLHAISEQITTQQAVIEQAKQELQQLQQNRDELSEKVNQQARVVSELNASVKVASSKLDQANARCHAIEQEINQLSQQEKELSHNLQQARALWQQALNAMEQDSGQKEQLESQRGQLQTQRDNINQQLRDWQNQHHQASLELNRLDAALTTTQDRFKRGKERLTALSHKVEGLALSLAEVSNPDNDLQSQLNQQLEAHRAAEQNLTTQRDANQQLEQQLSDLSKQRQQTDKLNREQQTQLNQLEIDAEGIKVRRTTIEEQLGECEQTTEQLLQSLPEEANESAWQEQLAHLQRRIDRLGAINLAAIEEFATESERKKYLDEQHEDLSQALATLESAISKIDKETRQRFKDTYDQVNESFTKLFPKLFGGGQAYLELTGEDLLDTGVQVMARPPGKRNSSIHLLSGGEKAMTAVALVFSIFKLSPSPFCMLDEVDAPLDDANVSRFCQMVKTMSSDIQFIFITHNKVTMELADHLSGVTMHEPGVSRIVAVDVEQAVSLAEA